MESKEDGRTINIQYLLKALEKFVEGLNNEDWEEIDQGIWYLDAFIEQHRSQITQDELEKYFLLFDEFLKWENWYIGEKKMRQK